MILNSSFFLSLSSSYCAHDEKWFLAFDDLIGQGSVGRFVGNIFAADEKADERAALECPVIADRSAQNRVPFFQSVYNCMDRHGPVKIDMHLVADFGQRAQMMR
jgi:hypothetical protein